MNLIDAPVETQEENHEYAAHNAANVPREAEYGWQHELPFVAGNCLEELTRRWQSGNQYLLDRAAIQPYRQPPLILHRHSMGQLLNLVDRSLTGYEE